MDANKLSRSVTLNCPTCGNTQFKSDDESGTGTIECVSCNRIMTREELLAENDVNIQANLDEIKEAAVKQVADALKKAFGGSKTIKIKL